MNDVQILDLQSEELSDLSHDELLKLLINQKTIKIKIPLSSINVSNSYIDIISDYLDASYAIEKLSSNFKNITIEKNWTTRHHPIYILTIKNFEPEKLTNLITKLIWAFQFPQEDNDETKFHDVRFEICQYEETITDTTLFHPEIIDDYLANLINGAYYELELEIFKNQLSFFPERNFGYWASAAYNNEEPKVLLSTDAWIIPHPLNPEHVFKRLGYEGDFSLLKSNIITINGNSIVISEGVTLYAPTGIILQAIACIEEVNAPKNEYRHKLRWSETIYAHSHSMNYQPNHHAPYKNAPQFDFEIFTSEFSDFFAVKTESAFIIIFNVIELQRSESEHYIAAAKQLFSSFDDDLYTSAAVTLAWHEINDETFEQLCYDIIYHSSKFDRSTIRKYGKSRSRDGGRDIEVYTKAKPGEKALKFIFQCKLSTPNKSIGTSNIGSITDILEQYNADGYGIMCNCYIDASLLDRLDAIAANRNVKIETWSKFEIERFIARRPVIKHRYFTQP